MGYSREKRKPSPHLKVNNSHLPEKQQKTKTGNGGHNISPETRQNSLQRGWETEGATQRFLRKPKYAAILKKKQGKNQPRRGKKKNPKNGKMNESNGGKKTTGKVTTGGVAGGEGPVEPGGLPGGGTGKLKFAENAKQKPSSNLQKHTPKKRAKRRCLAAGKTTAKRRGKGQSFSGPDLARKTRGGRKQKTPLCYSRGTETSKGTKIVLGPMGKPTRRFSRREKACFWSETKG